MISLAVLRQGGENLLLSFRARSPELCFHRGGLRDDSIFFVE
ncbi:MAG: hypothetical protein SWX82_14195 [Cyanobacteriota bacterium]|nr:hypothetical protein [Cyanobacteriota bacterium]MDY7005051.1 hypothetical protein [Cyanobacteriota bacterium]